MHQLTLQEGLHCRDLLLVSEAAGSPAISTCREPDPVVLPLNIWNLQSRWTRVLAEDVRTDGRQHQAALELLIGWTVAGKGEGLKEDEGGEKSSKRRGKKRDIV